MAHDNHKLRILEESVVKELGMPVGDVPQPTPESAPADTC
jgi:hypothetical protein